MCGETLETPIHICAFFDSHEERYNVILPYIQEGLDKNDKVINILESSCHHEHCKRLSDSGIPVEEKSRTKQLNVLASEDTYLKGGFFEAEKMLQLLEDALIEANNEGYHHVRACGEMEWALKNVQGTDELIEYEARLNLLVPKHSCSLICMYDINRFSGRVLTDVLATHSHVIMNGKIYKNPYYIEPFEFLPTLQRRRQSSLIP
ncbi:MEDS domain-containing protein [Flavobacterium limi]|uniref:MEDS domain-containing protein n=1 Tax=Flavobacterium limi TaxID=2045105 RepID=UPI001FCACE13|nr:MEDS domain-containing protein [Flavobacterium limi]